jgi:hypothetical protein
MPTRSKPMTDKQLEVLQAGRGIGAQIGQSLREAKSIKTRVVQGKREPTGAAKTLLTIAQVIPEALLVVT